MTDVASNDIHMHSCAPVQCQSPACSRPVKCYSLPSQVVRRTLTPFDLQWTQGLGNILSAISHRLDTSLWLGLVWGGEEDKGDSQWEEGRDMWERRSSPPRLYYWDAVFILWVCVYVHYTGWDRHGRWRHWKGVCVCAGWWMVIECFCFKKEFLGCFSCYSCWPVLRSVSPYYIYLTHSLIWYLSLLIILFIAIAEIIMELLPGLGTR